MDYTRRIVRSRPFYAAVFMSMVLRTTSGCQGERVEQAEPTDGDASLSDVASDSASEAPAEAGSVEAASAALCNPPGNLIVNGDFTAGASGWATDKATLQPIDGPCSGKGMRVYDVSEYGSTSRTFSKRLPKGTKLRLRAFFKLYPASGARTPNVFVRGTYVDDAGAEVGEAVGSVDATSDLDWHMVETTFTLPYDVTGLGIAAASRINEADEFAVAGLSLVVE